MRNPSRKVGRLARGCSVGLLMVTGLLAFLVPSASAGIPGTWEYTGSMNVGRESYFTVTLLPDGKVLITGGWSNLPTASAEIYDPALGTFAATGSMAAPRQGHTATLLPNGKVLIAGGGVNRAELYDPTTGAFAPAGATAAYRYYHTATLLPNGKVLIAGGRLTNLGITESAEIYDPAGGTVTTASMGTARISHTATLLPNGKVLIAAGYGASGDLQSAELFDGSSFYGVSSLFLNRARSSHTATLLPDGNVLIAGGGQAVAETYDSAIGTYGAFTNTVGSMASARYAHTATLLPNGRVLIAAGFNGSATYYSSAELYDPSTRTFTLTDSIGTARVWHTATMLPTGKVLVAGGYDGSGTVFAAELYTPTDKGGVIIPAWPMKTPRYGHTATRLNNGKVLIAGGYTLGGSQVPLVNAAELYDPATGNFAYTAGSMTRARHGHTATLLNNGKVLIAGGKDNTIDPTFQLASAELYDPTTETFTFTAANMVYSREDHTATLLPDGTVLIAGGYGYDYFNGRSQLHPSAEIYSPASNTFNYDSSMGAARRLHTATLLNNGEVLLAGGKGYDVWGNYVALNTAERYRPSVHSFAYTSFMSYPRLDHTATLLPDGRVLVANDIYPEFYDSTAQSFAADRIMMTIRYRHSATLLQNGDVFLAGGESRLAPTTVRSSTETYDTYFNSFSYAYPMDFPRKNHTSTVLQDGKVLIAGGVGSPFSAELYQPISFLPDLVVAGIFTTPSSPVAGQPVTVTVSVWNQGSVDSGSFFIDFYKDRATPPTPGLLGDPGDASCNRPGLAAGAVTDCVLSLSYAAAGTYRMYAFADREGQEAEGSEYNNIHGPQALVVQPPLAFVTIASSPAGREIIADGTTYTAPRTFSWAPGSSHVIGVASPQSGGAGIQYVYSSWSDSGTQSHMIETAAAAATYTATFATQYQLTTAVSPSGSGSVSPNCLGGCWFNSGAAVLLSASPATGYTFGSWAGALSGSSNPAALTMNAAKSVTANFTAVSTRFDLVVSALTAPLTANPGATITVTDTTKNNGPDGAPASVTTLYWSTNPTLDAADIKIESRSVSALAYLAADSGGIPVTIPAGTCSGTFYIIAMADGPNSLGETKETNNTRYRMIKIGPDLTVVAVTGPATAAAGQVITVGDTTKNNGGCSAGASTTKFYLSTNSVWDALDVELGRRGVSALGAGTVDTGGINVTMPAGTATGTRYIIAKADGWGVVAETSETNNTRARSILIGPDLIVSWISAPTSAARGATITVSDTTRNSGAEKADNSETRVYLSTNTTFDAADTLLGSRAVPILAAGALNTGGIKVNIPLAIDVGTYYLIDVADATAAVVETKETNNTRYRAITIY